MEIISAAPKDFERLVCIWEAAVRATHHFLPEEKIVFYRVQIPKYLAAVPELELAVENGNIFGFIGTVPPSEDKPASIEMLFVDPGVHGRGIGKALVNHVATKYDPLTLDVNEQNPGGLAFYRRVGFHVLGRSETDSLGDPFPLLHLSNHQPGQ